MFSGEYAALKRTLLPGQPHTHRHSRNNDNFNLEDAAVKAGRNTTVLRLQHTCPTAAASRFISLSRPSLLSLSHLVVVRLAPSHIDSRQRGGQKPSGVPAAAAESWPKSSAAGPVRPGHGLGDAHVCCAAAGRPW
jgi:hypothetical protein